MSPSLKRSDFDTKQMKPRLKERDNNVTDDVDLMQMGRTKLVEKAEFRPKRSKMFIIVL